MIHETVGHATRSLIFGIKSHACFRKEVAKCGDTSDLDRSVEVPSIIVLISMVLTDDDSRVWNEKYKGILRIKKRKCKLLLQRDLLDSSNCVAILLATNFSMEIYDFGRQWSETNVRSTV